MTSNKESYARTTAGVRRESQILECWLFDERSGAGSRRVASNMMRYESRKTPPEGDVSETAVSPARRVGVEEIRRRSASDF